MAMAISICGTLCVLVLSILCFEKGNSQSAADMKQWNCNSKFWLSEGNAIVAIGRQWGKSIWTHSTFIRAGWVDIWHHMCTCACSTLWSSGHPWVTHSVTGGAITSPPSPPSLSPSSRPASDWVPLGPPVRRWTSTGWGGCGRHEGREGGHGLPLGGGLGPSGFGPHAGCGPAARPTTAPPLQLPERFRRLLKLTNLSYHSRDIDHGRWRRTTARAKVYFL